MTTGSLDWVEMVLDHRLFDNLVSDLTASVELCEDPCLPAEGFVLVLAELETRPGDETVLTV